MKVKRTFAVLLALLFLICSLYGCKNNEEYSVDDISLRLSELCLGNADTYEVSKADIENRFNFDGNLLQEYSVKLCDTEEKYLCVGVFRPKNQKDRQSIIDGINSTVKATAASFGVLDSSQYDKIQHRLFYEYNDIIIFVVSDNYKPCEEYLKEIKASPIA